MLLIFASRLLDKVFNRRIKFFKKTWLVLQIVFIFAAALDETFF